MINTIALILLAAINPYEMSHPYPNMECMGSGGGPFAGDVCLNDDIKLGFGEGTTASCGDDDYWMIYNSSSTQWEFWSRDCDGATNPCILETFDDGTNDATRSGDLTLQGNADLEGYASIGNAIALSADRTLVVARDFTSSAAFMNQLLIDGTTTTDGGTGVVHHACIMPTGTVINSGNAHSSVYSMAVNEPVITLSSGTCTEGGVLYVAPPPTECVSNQSLFVAGDTVIDKTGSNTNSPSLSLAGDNAGNEVETSIYTAYGAQPYMVFSVDDDGTTPVLTQVVHLDDNSIRPASAGGIAAGSVSNYFSDVIAAEVSCLDSDASNQLSIDWSENDSSDRALTFAVNSGDRAISLSGDLTVEAASTINQDVTTDASVQFADLTLTAGPMIVTSDANGSCWGGSGCSDSKFYFDGTDYRLQCAGCVNGITLDAPLVAGVWEVLTDSGLVGVMNQEVTSSLGDGTRVGHVFKLDSNNVFSVWAESDGAGSIDELGTTQYWFNGAYKECTENQETLTFAGGGGEASKTTSGLIPKGATNFAVTAYVLIAGTTCTSADYGDGTTQDIYGDGIAVSAGTQLESDNWDTDVKWNASVAEEVTITAVGGNCVDMSVRVHVSYCRHYAPEN
jgi:hypothetical protein